MVRFATGFTGWVDNFCFSVVPVVGFAISDGFFVGDRVCLTTLVLTIFVVSCTVFVDVILISLFLELTTVALVVARIFVVIICWFGYPMVWFCGWLRHSVDLHFVCSFQNLQL